MGILGQLLGIEKGNPLGVLVLLTVTLTTLGWWIYSYPGRTAAKHLVENREKFAAWQAAESERYDRLWAEKLALLKRCEELEGTLARWRAEHG